MQVKDTLTIHDVMRIFHVSQVTVYRWVSLTRQGNGNFPLPIGGRKQKLLWNPDAIIAFQNANGTQSVPSIESAAQRQKRHSAAMARLRSKGVKVTPE
jgi:transposase-like protein